jgi:hypothetical protein
VKKGGDNEALRTGYSTRVLSSRFSLGAGSSELVSTGFAGDGRALDWFLCEQALQKGPHILSDGLLDDRGKLLTPPTGSASSTACNWGLQSFHEPEHRHSARR